jgi:hypothetical protein
MAKTWLRELFSFLERKVPKLNAFIPYEIQLLAGLPIYVTEDE